MKPLPMFPGLCLYACLFLAGCRPDTEPRSGDLLFVGYLPSPADSVSMASAIGAATGNGKLDLVHVALLDVSGGETYVIDATVRRGVDRHPLDTLIHDFTRSDGRRPELLLMRVRPWRKNCADAAVERARSLVGRPYDLRFQPADSAWYCSELVQECWRDAAGAPLFESAPMNFLAPDGSLPPYWTRLFERLGVEVPQGQPGTNPQAMSGSPHLKTIKHYMP